MTKQRTSGVSRRTFLAGSTVLAGAIGAPGLVGAQPAAVKVGMIHPVTGFVAYNGQQSRLGGTMAIEDVNKAGGIKSMGGAKLEALLGDSQSKVEVGVAEVEKMNEQGVAAYIGCYQSPVVIAASSASLANRMSMWPSTISARKSSPWRAITKASDRLSATSRPTTRAAAIAPRMAARGSSGSHR